MTRFEKENESKNLNDISKNYTIISYPFRTKLVNINLRLYVNSNLNILIFLYESHK